ncbi:hypothetical protein JKP88DRAFT_253147 [Tribonema minus]|uniref:Uncharacterized protein n=1 Tax=Tribonema minus TaxID=303371 RepID=A0A835ZCU0_9STRA|nr:hypothetical protein JKP88DRAFT_253147 [Tribonema minus]
MESADSSTQGLAKSAGASSSHGDGTCSSGPLSTQGFAQSAVDGGDGGVGTHSSVPLSVLLDGGSHDSGVISTAHGFALTSGVTGAGQCSSFYSAQSLVSQSGTASISTANATSLSLVGGHAGSLQGSHAAQAVAGHDGTMQPMGMGSGPTTTWGGISNDDTAASAGTGNGDVLLQQRVRAALQHQRPQLSKKATSTTYAIGYQVASCCASNNGWWQLVILVVIRRHVFRTLVGFLLLSVVLLIQKYDKHYTSNNFAGSVALYSPPAHEACAQAQPLGRVGGRNSSGGSSSSKVSPMALEAEASVTSMCGKCVPPILSEVECVVQLGGPEVLWFRLDSGMKWNLCWCAVVCWCVEVGRGDDCC